MLHWWRKAADVLYRHAVGVVEAEVLVQHGKDLVVEDLELPDPVDHLLQRLNNPRDNNQPYHRTHSKYEQSVISLFRLVSELPIS